MKTAQHETISNREFYFVLYMMLLYVIGWVIDVNGLFLSSYFNLAGEIMLPLVGGIVGLFVMSINKQQNNKNITKGRRRNFRFLPFVFTYNSYISYIRSGKDEKVEQLSSHLYLIDDFDLEHNERTGTYVLLGDDITLIETCAAPSLPYILDGLQQLHIGLNEVKNIIVTHVHLDHAGAAGLMMEKCPNATLYVHSRGARHMIDQQNSF